MRVALLIVSAHALGACDSVFRIDEVPPTGDLVPSNGVDLAAADGLGDVIVITGLAVFNTDTGAITGAVTRAATTGVDAGISYQRLGASMPDLGVFGMFALDVQPGGTIAFTGTSSAVFAIATTARIVGSVDGSGGKSSNVPACAEDAGCAGPGGGLGANELHTASGCAGGNGSSTNSNDGGGGGGGGGIAGATGGPDDVATAVGGRACLAPTAQPLFGGGGGGAGGPGDYVPIAGRPRGGGGGGGALQIAAGLSIEIGGSITVAGGGGDGGAPGVSDGGAGSGGGAGGTILLETPMIAVLVQAAIAANGGGGGGGGESINAGGPGETGGLYDVVARGGIGATADHSGGNGGAGTLAPTAGEPASISNGGGGGGGTGVIYLRTHEPPSIAGAISPPPMFGTF